jgi:hypothetical protein
MALILNEFDPKLGYKKIFYQRSKDNVFCRFFLTDTDIYFRFSLIRNDSSVVPDTLTYLFLSLYTFQPTAAKNENKPFSPSLDQLETTSYERAQVLTVASMKWESSGM